VPTHASIVCDVAGVGEFGEYLQARYFVLVGLAYPCSPGPPGGHCGHCSVGLPSANADPPRIFNYNHDCNLDPQGSPNYPPSSPPHAPTLQIHPTPISVISRISVDFDF